MVLEVICYPITEVISEGIIEKYSPCYWEKEWPNASYLAVFAISLPPGSLLATSTTKGLCPLTRNLLCNSNIFKFHMKSWMFKGKLCHKLTSGKRFKLFNFSKNPLILQIFVE